MKRTIKTLILGAGGQIGRELTNFFLQKYLSVTSCTKTQCDIRDESRVKEVINSDEEKDVLFDSETTEVTCSENEIIGDVVNKMVDDAITNVD